MMNHIWRNHHPFNIILPQILIYVGIFILQKQPPSKKLKTEKQELPPMLPQAKEEREPEVVVESGPVQYEQKGTLTILGTMTIS